MKESDTMFTYRIEFSQQSVWRKALGDSEPLRIASDPDFGSLDAKEYLPAGSSHWQCLISKGIGQSIYGAATTVFRRV